MRNSNDELARTRHAFEQWRTNRSRRTRIPQELWDRAISLLDHYPVTHVARQLHLDAAKLRKRRLAAHHLLAGANSSAPQFLEMQTIDLNSETGSTSSSDPSPPRLATAAVLRLQVERTDGHRLTLAVPASAWEQIAMLYSLFLRA